MRPALSMAPTTKSLVIARPPGVLLSSGILGAMFTWLQVTPPSQEMFTSGPVLPVPMNS